MEVMPIAHRARLRLHAADAAVALVAGADSPEGRHLRALEPTPAESAGLAAAIIRSAETDDIHIASCVTPTSIALPAAALTGAHDAGSAENAIRVAVELAVRMGRAIDGPTALYRGIWPTCFAAPFAVAAALSRLRGLAADQCAHALSLALMMSSGRGGRFAGEPSGRWLLLMDAVADGIRAVEAATHGFKGDAGLLDGPWLKNAVGGAPDMHALVDDLDQAHAFEALGLKPFSTARQALAPVEALQTLLNEGLDPATVDSIEVLAPQAYAAMISRPLEASRSSGYVNVGFQMALAALRPVGLLDLDRSGLMDDGALHAFAARVRVTPDAALDALYPHRWPGEIRVYAGGEELRRRIDCPRGDASNPLSMEDVRRKAQGLLAPLMSMTDADATFTTFVQAFETDAAFAAATSRMREALRHGAGG